MQNYDDPWDSVLGRAESDDDDPWDSVLGRLPETSTPGEPAEPRGERRGFGGMLRSLMAGVSDAADRGRELAPRLSPNLERGYTWGSPVGVGLREGATVTVPRIAGGALEAGGELLGAEGVSGTGRRLQAGAEARGEAMRPDVENLEGIPGAGMARTVGQAAATMVPIAAAAALGSTAGPWGALFGSLAASYGFGVGDIQTELTEQGMAPEDAAPRAVAGGVPYALLERIVPGRATGRLLGKVAGSGAAREAGRQAITEGITEGAQSALSQGLGDEGVGGIDWSRVGEEAKGGALTGGVVGGATGTFAPEVAPEQEEQGAIAGLKDRITGVAERAATGVQDMLRRVREAQVQQTAQVAPEPTVAAPELEPATTGNVELQEEPEATPQASTEPLPTELERLARSAFEARLPGMGDPLDEQVVHAQMRRLPGPDRKRVQDRIREIGERHYDRLTGEINLPAIEEAEAPSEASRRVRDTASRREAESDQAVNEAGGRLPVKMETPGGGSVLVHESTQEPGRVQVTRFDEDGPVGHQTFDTVGDAVRAAADEGARVVPAPPVAEEAAGGTIEEVSEPGPILNPGTGRISRDVAHRFGAEDFAKGAERVPPPVMESISERAGWLEGWDEANLAAETEPGAANPEPEVDPYPTAEELRGWDTGQLIDEEKLTTGELQGRIRAELETRSPPEPELEEAAGPTDPVQTSGTGNFARGKAQERRAGYRELYEAQDDEQLAKTYQKLLRGGGRTTIDASVASMDRASVVQNTWGDKIAGQSDRGWKAVGRNTQQTDRIAVVEKLLEERGFDLEAVGNPFADIGRADVAEANKDLVGRGGNALQGMSDEDLRAEIQETMRLLGERREDPLLYERMAILDAEEARRGIEPEDLPDGFAVVPMAPYQDPDASRREELNDLSTTLREKHPGIEELTLHPSHGNTVELSMMVVSPEARSSGVGSAVMDDIASWADENGVTVWLQPAEKNKEIGTTSQKRLVQFYKRFGFVENKGRNKDFELSRYARMYRRPRKSDASDVHPLVPPEGGAELPMDEASRLARAEEQGFATDAYHGTARPDRIEEAGGFLPERATSGPSAFFTDNPEVAGNYAKNKADTSRMDEGTEYGKAFKIRLDSGEWVDLDDAFKQLSVRDRVNLRNNLGRVTENDDMDGFFMGEGPGGKQHWEWQLNDSGRDPLKAAVDVWLNSANLFDREELFLDVLETAGFDRKRVKWDDPHGVNPGVIPVKLRLGNSFNTSDEKVGRELIKRLEGVTREAEPGVDPWDKRSRSIEEWVEAYERDLSEGSTLAWTSIPDEVSQALRDMGYNSIIDRGGKHGGQEHTVYIPLDPKDIRSVFAEFDPEQEGSRDLMALAPDEGKKPVFAARDEEGGVEAQVHPLDDGTFAVSLYDLDAEERVFGVEIVQTLDAAERRARSMIVPDAEVEVQHEFSGAATNEDLFGQPVHTGPAQGELAVDDKGPQGKSGALQAARAVMSSLEGRIQRGAATPAQEKRYQRARSLVRMMEGQGLDEQEVLDRREAAPEPKDPFTGDLFGGPTEGGGGLFGLAPAQQATERLRDAGRFSMKEGATEAPKPSQIAADLTKALAEALPGMKLAEGGLNRILKNRGALGQADMRNQVVRLVDISDIKAFGHEAGHLMQKLLFGSSKDLDEQLESLPGAVRGELEDLGEGISGGGLAEGWAEFWRRYLDNPDALQWSSTNVLEYVEGRLVGIPAVQTAWKKARDNWTLHREASPQARLRSKVSVDEDPRTFAIADEWARFRTNVLDDMEPIRKVMETLKDRGAGPKDISEDMETLARLTRGSTGIAEQFLGTKVGLVTRAARAATGGSSEKWIGGALSFSGHRKVGKSLGEILEPVKVQLDDFRDYMVARRAQELHDRDVMTGIRKEDADWVVDRLEKRFGESFTEAFDEIQKWNGQLLRYLRDAGVISAKALKAIEEKNLNYVPFYRVRDGGGLTGKLGMGFGHLFSPVKSIKGSGRDIIDPLESLVKNAFEYVHLAQKQQVSLALERLSQKEGVGDIFEKIMTPIRPTQFNFGEIEERLEEVVPGMSEILEDVRKEAKEAWDEMTADLDPSELAELQRQGVMPKGPYDPAEELLMVFRPGDLFGKANVISVLRGDKRQWYEIDKELYRALEGLDREQLDAWARWLAVPARLLRAGATLAPEFLIRNPARDQVMAFIQSEYGYKPGWDMAKGMFELIRKGEAYEQWRSHGGDRSSLLALDRKTMQNNIRELARSGGVPNVVKDPLDLLRAMSTLMEDSTRMGEFLRARKELGTSKKALQTAASASREISIDFARHGAKTTAIRSLAAFWNARLQGYDRLARAAKKDPATFAARVFTAITLPSLLEYYVNRDDEKYWEIPQWQRDLFWIFKVGDTYLRIPKPFELGLVFGTLPVRILESFAGGPGGSEELDTFFNDTLMREAESIAPFPTFVQPVVENLTNYSFFLRRPIDPRGDEDLEPQFRYGSGTSEVAKLLGRWAPGEGISPRQIDNLLYAWTGGLGRLATETGDIGIRALRDEPAPPSPTAADVPGVRGMVVRTPGFSSESVERFYRRYSDAQMAAGTIRELERRGEDEEIQKRFEDENTRRLLDDESMLRSTASELAALRSDVEQIRRDPGMSRERKRELIQELGEQAMELARSAIGRDRVDSN